MIGGSHDLNIAARASLPAGSRVGLSGPLALLLSGLILIAAIAPIAAKPAFYCAYADELSPGRARTCAAKALAEKQAAEKAKADAAQKK
jgi:hypothetical protein